MPGINDNFLDPEMNVDEFVERFELESREVYAQRHALVEALRLKPGMSVADVGAGTGLYEPLFSAAVGEQGRVYAVEIAPGMVEHLEQRKSEEAWANVEVVLSEARDVSLSHVQVDRVFMCDTYHHVEYPRAMMKSVWQCMNPGAELLVVDFKKIEGVTREWLMSHVRADQAQVLRELTSFGFEYVEDVEIDGMHENYVMRFRRPM